MPNYNYIWNVDEDSFPDPDYGIWGDQVDLHTTVFIPRSCGNSYEAGHYLRKQEREGQVSRDFNSYMIDLFNEGRK